MNLQNPPEVADGGYWYVVPNAPDPGEADRTPGDIPSGWCAQYGVVDGIDYAVIRTPVPVSGVPFADATPSGVIAAAFAEGSLSAGTRPKGWRVGGA